MKAACLLQLQRKSIIGPGFQDAEEIHIAFDSSEKINWPSIPDTLRGKHFLTSSVMVFFHRFGT